VTDEQLRRLGEVSRYLYEAANLDPDKHQPYVGRSAFAHKGGLHVSAIRRSRESYEHIDPAVVGNAQRVLISDLSGRSNLELKARELGVEVEGRADELADLLKEVKHLENIGFQFEGADASLELLLRKNLKTKERFFRLKGFRGDRREATRGRAHRGGGDRDDRGPHGQIEHTAATGNGPVHALDLALRKALSKFYPEVAEVQLHDYKVRVLQGQDGAAAIVRVLMESGDGTSRWGTVGVSHNVVEASWQALVDSIVYKLHKDRKGSRRAASAGT